MEITELLNKKWIMKNHAFLGHLLGSFLQNKPYS